jgi:hypothetical protein
VVRPAEPSMTIKEEGEKMRGFLPCRPSNGGMTFYHSSRFAAFRNSRFPQAQGAIFPRMQARMIWGLSVGLRGPEARGNDRHGLWFSRDAHQGGVL